MSSSSKASKRIENPLKLSRSFICHCRFACKIQCEYVVKVEDSSKLAIKSESPFHKNRVKFFWKVQWSFFWRFLKFCLTLCEIFSSFELDEWWIDMKNLFWGHNSWKKFRTFLRKLFFWGFLWTKKIQVGRSGIVLRPQKHWKYEYKNFFLSKKSLLQCLQKQKQSPQTFSESNFFLKYYRILPISISYIPNNSVLLFSYY